MRREELRSLPTIGEIAERYGMTLRALRFYEERKMLAPIRIGQHRLYDQQAETQIRKILEAKRLGYTIKKIRELLESDAGETDTILDAQRITERIAELRRDRDAIDRAIAALQESYRRSISGAAIPPSPNGKDQAVDKQDLRRASSRSPLAKRRIVV